MSSPIPIHNIYYLLLYSWDSLAEGEIADVSKLESNEIVDLFAAVLHRGINHLLRKGLHQSYLEHEGEIAGVRGRINIGVSARRMLAAHGRAYCHFDELSVDTLPNQILRSTVQRLLLSESLNPDLRIKLNTLNRQLSGIRPILLTKLSFRRVQLHGNNQAYRFLLRICELVLELGLLDEQTGDYKFRDFVRDEKRMARLFENFVFNFYKTHRADLSIRKERIYWQATSQSDPELRYLPTMETDISVRDLLSNWTLIIDTKFYKETFQTYYDSTSIHSAHLYQLYSYLKNCEVRGEADRHAKGMLLYPVVDRSVRLQYDLPGHSLQICTVDLAADWKEIHEELMDLLQA